MNNITHSVLMCASEMAYWVDNNGSFEKPSTTYARNIDNHVLRGSIEPIQDNESACLAFFRDKEKQVILSFRGTQSSPFLFRGINDWATNLEAKLEPMAGIRGKVHHGLRAELEDIWDKIKETMDENNIDKSYKIYVTGHSQGGGLAYLAAEKLMQELNLSIAEVVTFGALHVGDREFADYYNQKLPNTIRYINKGDIVPFVPIIISEWGGKDKAMIDEVKQKTKQLKSTNDLNWMELLKAIGKIPDVIDGIWSGDIIGQYRSIGQVKFIEEQGGSYKIITNPQEPLGSKTFFTLFSKGFAPHLLDCSQGYNQAVGKIRC